MTVNDQKWSIVVNFAPSKKSMSTESVSKSFDLDAIRLEKQPKCFIDAIHLQQQPKCLKILNFFTTIFFLFHVTPNFLNAGVSLLLFQRKLFVHSNQLFNWTLYFGTLAGHSMRDIYLFFFRTWELPYFCVHRHSFVNVFVGLCLYILGAVVMCLALD